MIQDSDVKEPEQIEEQELQGTLRMTFLQSCTVFHDKLSNLNDYTIKFYRDFIGVSKIES